MLFFTFFVLSLFSRALTCPIEGELYIYFTKCGNRNDWSLVNLESIGLLPHNGNTEAMRSSALSCLSSLPIHFKSGSTLELSVYVNTTSGQSGLTILILEDAENEKLIMRHVYDRSNKDFVAGWSTILLLIERQITGYITLLGVSQDQDVVLLDEVRYKFNEPIIQHRMNNEENLSRKKRNILSLLNFGISSELETVTEIRPDITDPYEPDVGDPSVSDDMNESDEIEADVSDPDVSEPDVSESDESDPDVSESDEIEPDVSDPDVSEPDISESDVSEQDVSEPDVSESDVTDPSETEPDVSEPDVTEPSETELDVSEPDVSEPDVTDPDVSEPSVSEPDVREPDMTEPDVTEPDVSKPDEIEPDVSEPDISDPDASEPDVNQPNSGLSAWAIAVISISCVGVTALAVFGAYHFGKISGKKQLPHMSSFPPPSATVAPKTYNAGANMSSFTPSSNVAPSTTYAGGHGATKVIPRVRPDLFDKIQNDFYDYRY